MKQTPLIAIAATVLLAGCGQSQNEEISVTDTSATADSGETAIHQGYSDTAPQHEVDGWIVSNDDINANLWNPRGKSEEQILERAQFLTDAYDLERTQEQQARAMQEGMAADIVVFDAENVEEKATYKAGENALPPVGLPHVIVNGVFVKRDGEPTGALPGLPIRYPVESEGRHKAATTEQWLRTFSIDDGSLSNSN